MSKPFSEMTVEELRQFMQKHRGEDVEEKAFAEYHARLDWKPLFDENASVEEIEQAANRLIAEKT